MKIFSKIYTAVIIFAIVLPLPPSTVIAMAVIATPIGRKHLDQDMMNATKKGIQSTKERIKFAISKSQETQLTITTITKV